MNIAIDGYEANTFNRVGIGAYAYETLYGLYKNLHAGTFVDVYLPSHPLYDLPKAHNHWQYHVKKPQKLWTFIGLPISLRFAKRHPDVVFSPTHYAPRFVSFRRVISVMDLSYTVYPELFRSKDLHQLVHWTKYSVEHASAVFTISEATKSDILKTYAITPERVCVTYPGLRVLPMQSIDVKKKYSLENPYILSVGTLQPRKNFSRLIEAFSQLKKRPLYKNYELVIVGKKGWLYEDILKAPDVYGVSNSVRFLDFVPNEDLPSLYTNAELFTLVSLYEGFGLPVLEAMHYGKLVVVSNISSLPEIAGNSGILVNPEKVSEIVDGLDQGLALSGTQEGKKRIEEGKNFIKKFNWDTAAQQTLDILEKVGNGAL